MTDKEKFKTFLSELNVMFKESQNVIYIEDHIDEEPGRYGASLDILFNDDESFKAFSPWGE